jgi:hypothetical protein
MSDYLTHSRLRDINRTLETLLKEQAKTNRLLTKLLEKYEVNDPE